MIFVGIDVAKDKHDCFIINSDGIILADVFTIPNNRQGFHTLLYKLKTCCTSEDSVKVRIGSNWALQLQYPRISSGQQFDRLCPQSLTYQPLSKKPQSQENKD